MTSHRKPRPCVLTSAGPRTAIGLTTAALASVSLLGESAHAAPATPSPSSITEVKAEVDDLYHQAEVATERYNGAKEETDSQRTNVDRLLNNVAKQTKSLNEARRQLGSYAAEQYRTGGTAATAQFLLAADPQEFFDQTHLMDRLSSTQEKTVAELRTKQNEANATRLAASKSLVELSATQEQLAGEKRTVQTKLTKARELLNKLTAEERQRLAELERKKRAEAEKKAEELAQQQREQEQQAQQDGGSGSSGDTSSSSAALGAKAVEFARAQLGKPYVWGATGPNSYDCSGLTQAAWKAAGVAIPRTTWDQVKIGSQVATANLQPGDLVFFYSDISHVGLYIGDGQMIHAPHSGANVEIAPITEMPIYGSVRPA